MSDVLRLKKDWFNPVYFHIKHYAEIPTIRRIMVYGGKSAAKTLSFAQFLSIVGYTQGISSILFRKEQTTIKTTIKQAVKKAVELTYLEAVQKPMDFKYSCVNGSEMIFKGLDTEGKVKGVEGYKYLMFDELDHFTAQEWQQANASLRGMPNQKLFATWNPVDENIWIKSELDSYQWTDLPLIVDDNEHSRLDNNSFVKISNDGKIVLIKTTYFDNKWVVGGDGYGFRDQNLIDEYERMKSIDENWYNVNVLGMWGVANKEGKFAYAFSKTKHVFEGLEYNDHYELYLSFDFNVNPITCLAAQHYNETTYCLRSFQLGNSNIYELCDLIRATYPTALYIVTGDATGRATSALVHDNLNYYKIIKQQLELTDGQIKVPTINPSLVENRVVVNAVLQTRDIKIDSQLCSPLIYDLTYCEVDADNKLVKDRANDKRNSDHLDTFRYYLNLIYKNILRIPKHGIPDSPTD